MGAQRQEIKLLKEGGADEDSLIEARARYRKTSDEYARFSKAMELPQQRERVTVDGLGNIGVGKYTKAIDKSAESGIIRAEEVKTVALENQRYGRNKETLVNKSYIDSGEYKRKFDNATDNPKVNKALYDCSKEALKHRSGTAFEDMYWIDATTGEIIHSVTDSTDERAIRYTESIKKALSGKSNIITLHTHPSSMPPSVDDFNSCYNNNYTEGYIACHNGKVFRYTSEQEISETLYNLYMNEFIEEGLEEFDAQIMTLKKIMENHSVSFMEV